MTTYDYRDISTGAAVDPEAGSYSIMELVREHRTRYVLKTSKGVILLRHLPLRMMRIIDATRHQIYPHLAELEQERQDLRPYFEGVPEEQWDKDALQKLARIETELQLTDMYALGVIVAPRLMSMEDYDDLLMSLDEDERQSLAIAVKVLSSPRPVSHVDPAPEMIAEKFGIKLVDEEMLENLTVTQANYFCTRIVQEREAIDRMMNQKNRVVGV